MASAWARDSASPSFSHRRTPAGSFVRKARTAERSPLIQHNSVAEARPEGVDVNSTRCHSSANLHGMDFLYALAPLQLRSYRVRRYLGEDQCIGLDHLAPDDRSCIRDLYDFLETLFVSVRAPEPEMAVQRVQA